MPGLVYFNGILMEEKEAVLQLSDRAYLYGEGLFETMKATQGFIPFLAEHLDRFFRGIELLRIKVDFTQAKMEFFIYQTLFHNQMKDASIRVNLSRPNQESGESSLEEKFNLVILIRPLPKIPLRLYEEGCAAVVEQEFRVHPDPLCQIKSTNYLRHLLLQEKAQELGVQETLLLNTMGRVTEGATTNLFIHDGARWITPPPEEGLLPGVTRRVLLDLLDRHQIGVQVRPLELKELRNAREAILTNAVREILPLSQIDDQAVGSGNVGENTRQLIKAFREEIQFRFEHSQSRRWGVEEPA